jgi:hypothetical protein
MGDGGRVGRGNWIFFKYWQDVNVVYKNNTALLKPFRAEIYSSLGLQHNSLLRKLWKSEGSSQLVWIFVCRSFVQGEIEMPKHSLVNAGLMEARAVV